MSVWVSRSETQTLFLKFPLSPTEHRSEAGSF